MQKVGCEHSWAADSVSEQNLLWWIYVRYILSLLIKSPDDFGVSPELIWIEMKFAWQLHA